MSFHEAAFAAGLQRRDTLKAAAAWLALGSQPAAIARQRSNIVERVGQIRLNGQPLLPEQTVQSGDQVQTGPNSRLIFIIGDAAFQVRPNSTLSLERGHSIGSVSQLHLLEGAVLSVWAGERSRQIITPSLSAKFRTAGLYAEVFGESRHRSYLCNCHGTLALSAGKDKTISTATNHQAFWTSSDNTEDGLMPADSLNHSDDEINFLTRLIR